MADPIRELMPGANFIARPRLSKLTYSGQKKITRLQSRSAIVAFSANDVYAIAELIRRQRGGAAVVLGALSPRTRNAQVALYQSGEVDFLVATDAIGMGLNLDVDHIAFAGSRKFDGRSHRRSDALPNWPRLPGAPGVILTTGHSALQPMSSPSTRNSSTSSKTTTSSRSKFCNGVTPNLISTASTASKRACGTFPITRV